MSLLVMALVVFAVAGTVVLWGAKAVQAPGPLRQPTNVVIEFGQSTPAIAVELEKNGVVSDHRLFVLTTYLTRSSGGDLKAGEYEIPAGASLAQVLSIIRSGRAVVHRVTVPEGWTTRQVVERLNAHPALTGTVTDIPPEGSLLPDTYVFQRGLERDVLLARMRDAQARLLDELWSERDPDLPIRSKEEAVILASIVEKETGVAEERRQVAAVFLNRLRRNMRLQSDPTIIYGIVGGQGRLDRPIRRSDIDETTPYNTYRINGLPPTPIANPGRDAIAAVLQPEATDHLYFVADGTGGHAFARTLNEHNENVRRWRRIEREAKEARQPQDEESPVLAAAEAELDSDDATEAELAEVVATEAEPARAAEAELPGDAATEVEDLAAESELVEEVATEIADVATEAEPAEEMATGDMAEASQAEALAEAKEPDTEVQPKGPAVAADTAAPDEPEAGAENEAPATEPPAAQAGEDAADSIVETAPAATAPVVPQPRPQRTGPAVTLAERSVPIPKPKPERN